MKPLFNSTFIQKFIVLQRGYHHARRLLVNKMNKIKSNDVKKKNSIKDKMDKIIIIIIIIKIINFTASIIMQY